MSKLVNRCELLNEYFNYLSNTSSRLIKENIIDKLKTKYPSIVPDLNFCFEVLAGKHKLGYTYKWLTSKEPDLKLYEKYEDYTIEQFVNEVLKNIPPTDEGIVLATAVTPPSVRYFMSNLVNREYRLGYSNKASMITSYSPMLAKRYPDSVHEQYYYIQEKLDGNRCIAHYNFNTEEWEFTSRSGKPLKVKFDMSWANKGHIFDGEVMTIGHAGSRDFTRTSGAINGKYTDKSALHYYIYDIVDEDLTYKQRKELLDDYAAISGVMTNTSILPVLDEIPVYVNPEYNWRLDEWLDKITAKGGEGIMLRDPDATYKCGKRTDALLKYKKIKTMDLRIVGWNEGNGKYAGAIGSFNCQTDDGKIKVSVSGMPDWLHYSDPNEYIGKIIEVAYFDESVNSVTGQMSLRFPRLKCFRDDKTTTSIY